jgi:putative transposase
MRTVKRATLPLNKEKLACLKKLCDAYSKEKRFFLDLLRDRYYQAQLGNPRKIRDIFVESGYTSQHGLQARHWKLALQDAIETWDKYWEAICTQIRQRISHHKFLSDNERHYAFWLLKGYSQFADLMGGNTPLPQFEVSSESCHRVASYIRRTVKHIRGKAPTVKKSRIAKFDANCYEVFEHEGTQYIKLMSQIPGKRICIPLCGNAKIKGNIVMVFSGNTLSIHVSHELKPKASRKGPQEAVDFGYTEVMTDTEGVRYGTELGKRLTRVSDDLHEKMQKRNKIYALEKKSPQKRTYRRFNLGKKKFNSKKKAARVTLEAEINKSINELIRSKNPSILITEKLSHLFTYNKSKSMNRKLSSWLRGKIQERISFKALAEGFRHEQVNPAYGSQSCPECDFVDSKNRNGDRFMCLYCRHEDMADRVAAKNYARRFGDPEIGEYTPYCQVKTILLDRFHRRLEVGQPMTVPGRTLETVELVRPPPFRSNEIFV